MESRSDYQRCTNCDAIVYVDWDGKKCQCGNRFTRKRQAGFVIQPCTPQNDFGPYGSGVSQEER